MWLQGGGDMRVPSDITGLGLDGRRFILVSQGRVPVLRSAQKLQPIATHAIVPDALGITVGTMATFAARDSL